MAHLLVQIYARLSVAPTSQSRKQLDFRQLFAHFLMFWYSEVTTGLDGWNDA